MAASWRQLPGVYVAMRAALQAACGADGIVLGHLSHAYPDGGNLYLIFRTGADSDEAAIERYPAVVDAALGACLAAGGTVSHHHGIGLGKARWLEREVGPVGHGGHPPPEGGARSAGHPEPGEARWCGVRLAAFAEELDLCARCHEQCLFSAAVVLATGRHTLAPSRKALFADLLRRGALEPSTGAGRYLRAGHRLRGRA